MSFDEERDPMMECHTAIEKLKKALARRDALLRLTIKYLGVMPAHPFDVVAARELAEEIERELGDSHD